MNEILITKIWLTVIVVSALLGTGCNELSKKHDWDGWDTISKWSQAALIVFGCIGIVTCLYLL